MQCRCPGFQMYGLSCCLSLWWQLVGAARLLSVCRVPTSSLHIRVWVPWEGFILFKANFTFFRSTGEYRHITIVESTLIKRRLSFDYFNFNFVITVCVRRPSRKPLKKRIVSCKLLFCVYYILIYIQCCKGKRISEPVWLMKSLTA